MRITAMCLLIGCLVLPACERAPRTSAAPEESIAAERDNYEHMVAARLDEFEHRFDGLDARLKGLNRGDQEHLRMDIAELRDRKDALKRKFGDMKDVSDESWRDIRSSMDRGLDQLEVAYNVVAANNHGTSHERFKFEEDSRER
jgi:hypothetical protein